VAARAERFHDLVSGRSRGCGAAIARAGLWAASVPYGWAVRTRNLAFNRGWKSSSTAAVPVVSVGNLTLGGTGKTPCVEYLAGYYRQRDVRVVILSRGYGGDGGPNDEALVLEDNLDDVPHLQGADRAALAATAVEELEAELLLLDDGFQHRTLRRDLDVVLCDAADPFGGGHLFPRGLLREPASGLRRASAVVLTRCGAAGERQVVRTRNEIYKRVRARTPVVESEHQPVAWRRDDDSQPPDAFAGQTAVAFCGIGQPDSFRKTLEDLGVQVREWRTFPDHHNYTRADVDGLRRWAEGQPPGTVVLTTQKDAVKLRIGGLAGRPVYWLRIGLDLRAGPDRDALHGLLDRLRARNEAV
jgi:tetraacyldisaccharide 4'-kinase